MLQSCYGTRARANLDATTVTRPGEQQITISTRLLIIDDEAGITKFVGLVAAQLGMEFRALNSPATAIETFIAFKPDILMLDMSMPERDGIDVLNEVLLTGIPVRIVVISGFGEADLRLGEGVAGFHDITNVSILQKPFRRADLIAILRQPPTPA